MTKNEILEYFKDINHAYNDCTRYDTLKRMIDELQEPCTDAISRQAVLSHAKTDRGNGHEQPFDYVEVDVIKQLPPVKPQYTDTEIQKMQDLEFAEIQKAYEIGKAENPNRWGSVIEDIKSEINELSELGHIEPTYEDCKRDVLEILDKYKASPTGAERQKVRCGMQIVIEIPGEDYIRLRDEGMFGNVTTFKRAVREATPLPKGHGRLIDADVAVDGMEDDYEYCEAINATPTIIEADRAESEGME